MCSLKKCWVAIKIGLPTKKTNEVTCSILTSFKKYTKPPVIHLGVNGRKFPKAPVRRKVLSISDLKTRLESELLQ